MPEPTRQDAEKLKDALAGLIVFVKGKGRDYYYEMKEDMRKAPPAISPEDLQQFIQLDAAVADQLQRCNIELKMSAVVADQRGVEGTYNLGRTSLRCKDSKVGPKIVYSYKWMVQMKGYLQSAENLHTRLNNLPPSEHHCRIQVKVEGGNYSVSLDGGDLQRLRSSQAGIYLRALVKAGKGVQVSSPDILREIGVSDASLRPARLKNYLPDDIADLIDTKPGTGSWLLDEAWLS